tara:strand:+ start:221 stop:403 length:183 start_codon:yes stop_codon:yes gene_type:complete
MLNRVKKLIFDIDIKVFLLLITRQEIYKIKQYRMCTNLAQSIAIAKIIRKEKVEKQIKYT